MKVEAVSYTIRETDKISWLIVFRPVPGGWRVTAAECKQDAANGYFVEVFKCGRGAPSQTFALAIAKQVNKERNEDQ